MSPDASRPRPDIRAIAWALAAVLVVGCSILAFVPQPYAPLSGVGGFLAGTAVLSALRRR